MTIVDALRTLELPIKSSLDIKEVKSQYKLLIRKCHPDINPDIDGSIAANLNEAYSIASQTIENGELPELIKRFSMVEMMEQRKQQSVAMPTVVITVAQLCDIYAGKTLEVKSVSGEVYSLNKENKSRFKLVITFDIDIDTGVEDTHISDQLSFNYNHSDTYESAIDIYVDTLKWDYKAKLSCANSTMNINMPGGINRIRLRIKFEHYIMLNLTLTKKVKHTA